MNNELTVSQLETFDAHYVNEERWGLVEPLIRRTLGCSDAQKPFVVLDVGGGNGAFADRILGAFERAEVLVAEPADVLRERNAPHPRKTCLNLAAEELRDSGLKADLICFNWVLHHLVEDTYKKTVGRIAATLREAAGLLNTGGHISIYENNYNGYGIPNLPGRITYQVGRSSHAARYVRRKGMNTAGVGVCFLSRVGWLRTFDRAALSLDWECESATGMPGVLARRRLLRAAIGLRDIRVGHYWLSPLQDRDQLGAGPDSSRDGSEKHD